MKLIAGLVALAAAEPKVIDCNAGNGGAAAMSMTIAAADVQQAPAGWALDKGVYSHTVPASTGNTAMNTKTNELVMTHTVASDGCKKEDVDGVKVCTKTGHLITFTCSYPMKNQDIKTQTDFKVSGSDTEKTAAGTGKLTYKLAVDKASFSIGSKVTATITPVTIGLVHATIESCKVTHKGRSESVKLIDDGMQRECKLGVDVTTAQGTGVLGFNWSSFKWSTELSGKSSPDEDQEVSCNISLSKAQPTTETQNDCNAAAPAAPSGTKGTELAVGKICNSINYLGSRAKGTQAECYETCYEPMAAGLCTHFSYFKATTLNPESSCNFYSACDSYISATARATTYVLN